MSLCPQREKEKLEAANRALKRLQKKLRDEELRIYMGVDGEEGEERKPAPAATKHKAGK